MSEATVSSTTWAMYRRLLVYSRPYAVRLSIGIAAGILVAGSLFALLRMSPNVLRPFEQPVADVAESSVSAYGDSGTRLLDDVVERFGIETTHEDGRMTWQFVALTLVAIPILLLVRSGCEYINRYYLRWVGARVVMDLRNKLFTRLQGQSLKFFGKCDIGRLISRCTNDAAIVETVISTTVSDVTKAPFEIAAAAAFAIIHSKAQGLLGLMTVMFLVFPLCIIPIILLARYVKRFSRRAFQRIAGVVSRMHEVFTGIRVVKAFNTGTREVDRFRRMNAEYFGEIVKALRAELLMSPLMEGVAVTLVCVFIVVCYSRGALLSQILPVAFAAIAAYRPIKNLARISASVQKGAAALERIFETMDSDTALAEAEDPVVVEGLGDRVIFDKVGFRYGEEAGFVLDDICIDIERGHVVALVGETGSGKTTVANLLARFYDPTSGSVTLDGNDLRQISVASLRKIIGVVTQETILFNDTIANNISYGTPDATREQIEDAARKANAHEFIVSDSQGYDRVVGEKGFVLSGGERQRVAIARAILRDPPILILDEATSALDTVTERLVQEAISRVMEHRTVLAIAHRLSTIKHADQIILMDKGKIAERGTHDELYEAHGHYRALCDMQILDG